MRQYLYDIITGKRTGVTAALIRGALTVLSYLYGACVIVLRCIRRMRRHRLPCVVVSVGNVTLGGTGKTSLVEYIARVLLGEGHRVAVVSRGYGRQVARSPCLAGRQAGHQATGEAMGDEPCMLQGNLPSVVVAVDANRVRAAKKAVAEGEVDTVILDDGLQQWGLHKDLEIVTIDATNPFGNARLLPAGLLRQPLWTLRSAQVLVITKTNLAAGVGALRNRLRQLSPRALIVEARHEPSGLYLFGREDKAVPLTLLSARPVAALSGIADPASFEALLEKLGASIRLSFRYPDHHAFSDSDMEEVRRQCQGLPVSTIVTTQKDSRRLTPRLLGAFAAETLVLRVAVSVTSHENEFTERLIGLYRP